MKKVFASLFFTLLFPLFLNAQENLKAYIVNEGAFIYKNSNSVSDRLFTKEQTTNKEVIVLGIEYDYYKIIFNNVTGYVNKNQIVDTGNLKNIPKLDTSIPTKKYSEMNKRVKSDGYDFRKVKWGMTMEQVKKIEKGQFHNVKDNVIAYSVTVANKEADLFYSFIDNKLVSGAYFFNVRHTNPNAFIDDYYSLKDLLSAKYAEPSIDDINWLNELYKDEPSEKGFAVSLGHLNYRAKWFEDSTDITLTLTGENYKCNLMLGYASVKYIPQMIEQNKGEQTEGL